MGSVHILRTIPERDCARLRNGKSLAYIHTCIHTHVYTYTRVYKPAFVYTDIDVCVQTHIHKKGNRDIDARIETYTFVCRITDV